MVGSLSHTCYHVIGRLACLYYLLIFFFSIFFYLDWTILVSAWINISISGDRLTLLLCKNYYTLSLTLCLSFLYYLTRYNINDHSLIVSQWLFAILIVLGSFLIYFVSF